MKKIYFSLVLSAFLGLALISAASAEISANVDIQRYGVRNITRSESVYSQNIKAVDNDELEFSVNVKNTSSDQADGAVLYVYLPTGFPLDSNSIYIDGSRTGGNISNGLFLGYLNAGTQKDIVFKTRVNASFNGYAAIQALVAGENFNTDSQYVSISKSGSEVSTTVNSFPPTPTPTPTPTPLTGSTNQNNNLAVSLMGKNLTKEDTAWQKAIKAQPDNLLEFSIMLYTNSSLVARNAQVKVRLDNFLDFVPGSVTNNGYSVSDNIILDPVLVGNISIHETKFVKFQVRVQNASQFGKDPIILSNAVQVWADNNVRIIDYSSVSVAVKQETAKAAVNSAAVSNKNNGGKVVTVANSQKPELVASKETKTTEKKSFLFGAIGFGSFGLLIILILIALIVFLIIALVQEKKKCKDKTAAA